MINRIKENKLLYEFLKYCIVGGLAFIIDAGTLFFLTNNMKVHYLISACIAFLCGMFFNYILSCKLVFASSNINGFWPFVKFLIIGLVGLLMTEILMWISVDMLKIYLMLSKAMVTAIVLMWNFFARKLLIFNEEITCESNIE